MNKLKFFTALIVFVFYTNTNAQIPVTDATAVANLLRSIEVASSTLDSTNESLNLAKDAIEKAKKVNNALQSSKLVLQIANNLKTVQEDINYFHSNLNKIENDGIKKTYGKNIDRLLTNIDVLSSVISDVTTNNILSMKDGERLSTLMDLYDRTNNLIDDSSEIKSLFKRTLGRQEDEKEREAKRNKRK